MQGRPSLTVASLVLALQIAALSLPSAMTAEEIRGSTTYRPEVVGKLGVVAAGRHFAAEAGMRMFARGGNAVDAGVAATFAAAVTEISHFGLGGEVPIILYLADRKQVVVISGQGTAPAAASVDVFREHGIPSNGASAGTVPAVVDALTIALAEFGTLSLADVLAPAISLADGFPWYDFLTYYLRPEIENIRRYPSGARVYLQGPEGRMPAAGSSFGNPILPAPSGRWPSRSSGTSSRDAGRQSTPLGIASTGTTLANRWPGPCRMRAASSARLTSQRIRVG